MERTPFLEAKNISKTFFGVSALKNVDLQCYQGEILGVIGENGAGKSTLMKIIAGSYSLEAGEIYVDGSQKKISNPTDAQKLGIGMVYQDTRLVSELTVLQNCCLNNEDTKSLGVVDYSAQKKDIIKLFDRFGIQIDIHSKVKYLTIAQKQLVEIAKVLLYESRLLILDEPTSSLTPKEVDKLFEIVREIAKNGTSVVFISHRIPELMNICDRFVVLKDGIYAGQTLRKETNENELIHMMVGREIKDTRTFDDEVPLQDRKVLMEVRDLSCYPYYSHVNFKLYEGEILGFYGIEGNGQREILRSVMGLIAAQEGRIEVEGVPIAPKSPRQAIDAGISFLTNDRHGMNVFMPLSIKENITAANLKSWSSAGVMNKAKTDANVEKGKEDFRIKCTDTIQLIRELSGGNQQKVAIASRYLNNPKIFIFDEPTIGVDVGSKDEIYEFLQGLAKNGVGVIILSSDITEILRISDRILTVTKGEISREFSRKEANEEAILDASINHVCEMPTTPEEVAKCAPKELPQPRKSIFNSKWSNLVILAILIALMGAFGGAKTDAFLSSYNIGLLLMQFVPLAFVALGHSSVVMLGMIDLSVGSIVSLTTCIMSYVMRADSPIPMGVGILICLAAGLVCGLVNGFIVVKLEIPHYIATVGTQTAILGLALILRPSAGGNISKAFTGLVNTKIGLDFPAIILIVLVLYVLLEFILQKTKKGVHFYAVGSCREAAFSSGINTDRYRMLIYVFSAVMATLGGIVLAVRIGCGDPQAGTNFTTNSLSALVLGGVALSGGSGTFAGPIMGSFLIIILQSFLNMIRVPAYYQYVYTGLLIILAVAFYHRVEMKNRKKAGLQLDVI